MKWAVHGDYGYQLDGSKAQPFLLVETWHAREPRRQTSVPMETTRESLRLFRRPTFTTKLEICANRHASNGSVSPSASIEVILPTVVVSDRAVTGAPTIAFINRVSGLIQEILERFLAHSFHLLCGSQGSSWTIDQGVWLIECAGSASAQRGTSSLQNSRQYICAADKPPVWGIC